MVGQINHMNSSGNVKLTVQKTAKYNKKLCLTSGLDEVGPNLMYCMFLSSADIKPQSWRDSWRHSQNSTCSLSNDAAPLHCSTVWFMLSQPFLSPAPPHHTRSSLSPKLHHNFYVESRGEKIS